MADQVKSLIGIVSKELVRAGAFLLALGASNISMARRLSSLLTASRRSGADDVIGGLMNIFCTECAETHSINLKEIRSMFRHDPEFVTQQKASHPELDDIRTLMSEYREFEKGFQNRRR